jgi:hypothetical protein
MSGEYILDSLLRDMQPIAVSGEYVFCTVQESQLENLEAPLLIYRESEGPTVVVTKSVAERNGFDFSSIWGLVTLTVHSDLEAVGFLAAITNHLSKAGISVNVVSAFYHDHLFVPYERVDEVMSILSVLSESSRLK